MTQKLIAFDIDGTLLTSSGEVLPSTKEALHLLRENGHLVTIATGRSYFLAKRIIEDLAFENYLLVNGAAAFLDHQQVVKEVLAPQAFKDFVTFSSQQNIEVSYQNLYEIHRFHKEVKTPIEEAMASFRAAVPPFDPTFHLTHEIYQGIAYYPVTQDSLFENRFPEFDLVRWHPYGVDVLPKGNSKAKGLLKMATAAKIPVEDVLVFGDGLNDREMLAAAGTGIAMGNAGDDVKQHANLITDTNNENGIYNALKKLALI